MRKKVIVSCLAAGSIILIYLLVVGSRQPTYQGKSLRTWLDVLFPASGSSGLEKQRAEEAVRQIGPEAVPWLLKWLQAKDCYIGKALAQRMNQPFVNVARFWRPAVDDNLKALPAFKVLGSVADSAVPQLIGMVTNGTDKTHEFLAVQALCAIGSERSFQGLMSLEGTRPMFTAQFLTNSFLASNPSMANHLRRRSAPQ